jgi:hypothetical protein
MLNFAEQTGSGAVIVVWSSLFQDEVCCFIKCKDVVPEKRVSYFTYDFLHTIHRRLHLIGKDSKNLKRED